MRSEEQILQQREGDTKQESAHHTGTVSMPEDDLPSAQPLATIVPSGWHDDFTTLDDLAALDECPEAQEWSRSDTGHYGENENVNKEGCYHLFFLRVPLPNQVAKLLLVQVVAFVWQKSQANRKTAKGIARKRPIVVSASPDGRSSSGTDTVAAWRARSCFVSRPLFCRICSSDRNE